ncbi:MAG: P-loop NTPase fold protein [Nitrospirota bacterium]|nr:P-loop NTPase fold protein [Nitrospirota bacterium]
MSVKVGQNPAEYLTYGLHGLIKRYRTILSEGLRQVGILEATIPEDPESVRQELEMWLTRARCRLLVIIDDIDRLSPEEILATFKVTALTARFQNVVFLLAFDDHIVIRSLARIGIEPSYLGKVIQQAISLPPAEQEDIDRFLLLSDPPGIGVHRSAIDILFDELRISDDERQAFDKEIVQSYITKLKLLFTTLRDCKRFVNNLRGTLPALYREVNLYDFVLLEMLHVFAPTVYKDIWEKHFVYLPHWSQEVMLVDWFGLYLKEQEKNEAIKSHVQTLLAEVPLKEVIQFIIEELFPERVGKALSPMGGGTTERSARAERRLTHPACFQKYFLCRLAKNDLPDALVLGILDDCNREDESLAEKHFKQQLGAHLQSENFIKIIEKLIVFIGRVSPDRVRAIIRAISSIAHEINPVNDDFWRSELSRAELYVARLLDENAESVNCTNILAEVIANTRSLLFLVLLVHTVVSGREGFTRIRSVVDQNLLRELASTRLKTYYLDGGRDIFIELPDSKNWVSVLSQWGKNWDGDNSRTRATVTEYIVGLFDRDPYYVGTFLERFVEKDLPSGAGFKFNIEFLKQFTDHKEIWDRAKATGLRKSCKTDSQRNAFRMFEGLSVPHAEEEADS